MIGKAAYAEQAKPQQGPPEKRMKIDGTSEIQEVQVAGNLAYLWSKLRVDVTPPGGEKICRAGHTLTVFRKSGGKWLLARDANLLT
jgi:ketosteroid isomerase-like protein